LSAILSANQPAGTFPLSPLLVTRYIRPGLSGPNWHINH